MRALGAEDSRRRRPAAGLLQSGQFAPAFQQLVGEGEQFLILPADFLEDAPASQPGQPIGDPGQVRTVDVEAPVGERLRQPQAVLSTAGRRYLQGPASQLELNAAATIGCEGRLRDLENGGGHAGLLVGLEAEQAGDLPAVASCEEQVAPATQPQCEKACGHGPPFSWGLFRAPLPLSVCGSGVG